MATGTTVASIELKNATDEGATIWSAYAQLQTYKAEIGSLLQYNAALVLSDGLQARIGSITANQEWFKVWRTIDGDGDAPKTALELELQLSGRDAVEEGVLAARLPRDLARGIGVISQPNARLASARYSLSHPAA